MRLSFLERLGFTRCPRLLCAEYNIMQCCSEEGHKGDCCFVVAGDYKDADAIRARAKGE